MYLLDLPRINLDDDEVFYDADRHGPGADQIEPLARRRLRRYFPDFFIKYTDKRGNIRKSVIEVKPMRETKEPVVTKKKSKKTLIIETTNYIRNQAKWKAAREFCKDRKLEFKIMTEKELGV